MRCLWLTRQLPLPANSGELIYSRGLLESLAASGVDVTVLTYDGPESTAETLSPDHPISQLSVGAAPSHGLGAFFSSLPRDAFRLRHHSLLSELRRQLQQVQYDVVVIDQAAMGWVADEILRMRRDQRPSIVYASQNQEAKIRPQIARHCRDGFVMRMAMRLDAWKYANLERRLCQRADLITSITPEDRRFYSAQYADKPVIELLPGYDQPDAVQRRPPLGPETPRRVLIVGSFEWIAKRHNLDAFLQVAGPEFQRAGIELQIVGKASESYVDDLRRRFDFLTFERNVPSVVPYLKAARLGLIAESVGGGFKLKILDYAFHFLPIGALTDAMCGVDLQPSQDAIVESTIPELVEEIVNRIDDYEFLNSAADRTYAKLKDRFHWRDRGVTLSKAMASVRNGAMTASE